MKADELKVVELLDFRAGEGIIAFHDRRMVLQDADAMGILRRELVETIGWTVARGLLTRLGYANGYRDAHTLKALFRWENPEEWYKAGPILQALEGNALAVRTRITGLSDGQAPEIEIKWENCHETEQHLRHLGPATEPVLESELFGHVRGSFTGAVTDKKGLFEEANHGTLLLDEIAETPPTIQVKLLRALQEREIRRVGATTPIKVSPRVIAATNRNLEQAVARREFRPDLYYRLNVINVAIPPLRERGEDIVPLARLFLERFARAQGKEIQAISAEALDLLAAYAWPGNVRELENVIERAVVLARRDRITVADLPPAIRAGEALPPLAGLAGPLSLAELEKRAILATLERHRGNRTRAAKELRISLHTLWRKLKAYKADSVKH